MLVNPDISSAEAVNTAHRRDKLSRACKDFEAMFLSYMLKVMRRSAEDMGGMFTKKDNQFQDLFEWEVARTLSARSPLGIADALMKSMKPDSPGKDGPGDSSELTRLPLTRFVAGNNQTPHGTGNIDNIINSAARRHNVDSALIRAIITCESGGNTTAVSSKGAKGLMQLMDSTAADLGVDNPFNPAENVNAGAAYLKRMLDMYHGNTRLALAAYNAGPGAVDRYSGEIPPYPETQNYVSRVMSIYKKQLSQKPVVQPQPSDRSMPK